MPVFRVTLMFEFEANRHERDHVYSISVSDSQNHTKHFSIACNHFNTKCEIRPVVCRAMGLVAADREARGADWDASRLAAAWKGVLFAQSHAFVT